MKREQDIVINAILVGVEQTKNDVRTTAADVKESLAAADRIDHGLRSVVNGSRRINKYIESKQLRIHQPFSFLGTQGKPKVKKR